MTSLITTKFVMLVMTVMVSAVTTAEDLAQNINQTGPRFHDGEYASRVQLPTPLRMQMTPNGKGLINGMPMKAIIADPTIRFSVNEPKAPSRLLGTEPSFGVSTFSISYSPAGSSDPWGAYCEAVPDGAKAAFSSAGAIWGNIVKSMVPIKIQVCWSNIGSSSILGYSGGGSLWRDFDGAKIPGTWYSESLGNALRGIELDNTTPDMYITYNSVFSWYFGTDGNPPYNQWDLVTVALHEIAHGLNFSGTMKYASGVGSWGFSTGYPGIYDRYIEDFNGISLLNTATYPNSSVALGTALVSQNLWFDGANAVAANGGSRVKMYAPSTWAPGSSYSHLDYNTFNETPNQLMTYAISAGVVQHEPGPVTLGILKDLGWEVANTTTSSTRLINIATRGTVGTGDYVLIGGFVISGDPGTKKQVVVRGIGPSMPSTVPNRLANPEIYLFDTTGVIGYNDNWGTATNSSTLQSLGFAPGNALESAILTELAPGAYTFHLRGVNNTTGMGLVEVFSVE